MGEVVETRRAVDGEDLLAGDVVRTGCDPSTVAEILHRNGSVSRLDAETEVTVDRLIEDGRARIVVTVGPGRTWHRTTADDDPTLFEVRCPGAVVTAGYACFALRCRLDGSAEVSAVDGHVVVRGAGGGSLVLSDGQRACVDAAGVVVGLADGPDPDLGVDGWVALNRSLDGVPDDDDDAAPWLDPGASPRELPGWAGRAGAALAAAAFVGVLALTFFTADKSRPVAPAGASAIQAAAQPAPAPEPAPTTTLPPPPAPPPPPAAVAPTATVTPQTCRQSGRTIVYSGTLANTSAVASGFAVDAVFVTRSGSIVGRGTATVADVAPGKTARWEVRSASSVDLRNTGASCETAGVRPL